MYKRLVDSTAKKITSKTTPKTVVKKSTIKLGKIVNKSVKGKASSTGKFAAELKPRVKPKK